MKEYNTDLSVREDEGYKLDTDGNIWFNEYKIIKTKGGGIGVSAPIRRSRQQPEQVSDVTLDVLIGTYIYQYVDKPGVLSTHQTQLLAALLELKDRRTHHV